MITKNNMNTSYPWAPKHGAPDEKFDPSFTSHTGDEPETVEPAPNVPPRGPPSLAHHHPDPAVLVSQAHAQLGDQQQQHYMQIQEVKPPHHMMPQAQQAPPQAPQIEESQGRYHRPVLTTKRAAQNRNAQRAFRQRKEKHIKELEAKAAEADLLRQRIEELQAENIKLRDYTLKLQSRVIELSPAGAAGLIQLGDPSAPSFVQK